jgi:ATP-dependent Clp protease ATP-binding subunit ClpA
MKPVSLAAFDEATARGHHWAGEEHLLLALLADKRDSLAARVLEDSGVSYATVSAALSGRLAAHGSPVRREAAGCRTITSYHTVLGRARGFALGLGRSDLRPEDILLSLMWDPAGATSALLSEIGISREGVVGRIGDVGFTVPPDPLPESPLQSPSEREAVALGHDFIGGWHVMLALMAGEPDSQAGQALEDAGLTHAAYAAWLTRALQQALPPTQPQSDVIAATPNPWCWKVLAMAGGLAAAQGDAVVRSTHGLIAVLWMPDGPDSLGLESVGTTPSAVAAALGDLGVRLPHVPLPMGEPTSWGEPVFVPLERLDEVRAKLGVELPAGGWGFNENGRRAWVVAHANIDLRSILGRLPDYAPPPDPL